MLKGDGDERGPVRRRVDRHEIVARRAVDGRVHKRVEVAVCRDVESRAPGLARVRPLQEHFSLNDLATAHNRQVQRIHDRKVREEPVAHERRTHRPLGVHDVRIAARGDVEVLAKHVPRRRVDIGNLDGGGESLRAEIGRPREIQDAEDIIP